VKILSLDTSTRWGGVALVAKEEDAPPVVVAELACSVQASHAQHLLRWVDGLLSDAGWGRSDVDLFVATRGPGSFTGIRVGLGTLRGLALATGARAVSVTTLEALAEAYGPTDRQRIAVMDAGRGEFYGARYDAASRPPVELEAPWALPRGELVSRLPEDGCVLIPGPGTTVELDVATPPVRIAPTPRGIAAAAAFVAAGREPTPEEAILSPLYIRPPDAILKRRRG
jgi:tRNA threonylcarbamoyladenosine biosynthesis protein TsaB